MAKEKGLTVDVAAYEEAFKEHQEKSKAGSEGKFACGLADHKEETTRLHTATHLLHAALKKVLGEDVNQKGSNITEERLRFDFNFPRAMTAEEIKAVEDLVNEQIAKNIPVEKKEISLEEAKAAGRLAQARGRLFAYRAKQRKTERLRCPKPRRIGNRCAGARLSRKIRTAAAG